MSEQFPAHNEIMELLYGKPARQYLPDIIDILGIMDWLDDAVLPLLTRLLTTGSDKAREAVRKNFLETAYTFQMAYDGSEGSRFTSNEEDAENWDRFLDGYERPAIRNNILGVWNAANINDEAYSDTPLEEVIAGMRTIPFYVDEINPDADEQAGSDHYWRGMAAVSISRHGNTDFIAMDRNVLEKTVPGFVEWSGNHDDIARVISLAIERGTFDRSVLEELLAEQHEKTVLSSGVL